MKTLYNKVGGGILGDYLPRYNHTSNSYPALEHEKTPSSERENELSPAKLEAILMANSDYVPDKDWIDQWNLIIRPVV